MLQYVGGGYIPDVPAKDLTDDEVKALPVTKTQLLKSGLFVEVKPSKKEKEAAPPKDSGDDTGEGS